MDQRFAIGPVWPLPFQPRVFLLHHTLIQPLEQQRRLAQRRPRRQHTWGPGTDRAIVIVGQRGAAARLPVPGLH